MRISNFKLRFFKTKTLIVVSLILLPIMSFSAGKIARGKFVNPKAFKKVDKEEFKPKKDVALRIGILGGEVSVIDASSPINGAGISLGVSTFLSDDRNYMRFQIDNAGKVEAINGKPRKLVIKPTSKTTSILITGKTDLRLACDSSIKTEDLPFPGAEIDIDGTNATVLILYLDTDEDSEADKFPAYYIKSAGKVLTTLPKPFGLHFPADSFYPARDIYFDEAYLPEIITFADIDIPDGAKILLVQIAELPEVSISVADQQKINTAKGSSKVIGVGPQVTFSTSSTFTLNPDAKAPTSFSGSAIVSIPYYKDVLSDLGKTKDDLHLLKIKSESSVSLEELPADVTSFPASLKNKIEFGEKEGQLIFKGVMSDDERDELLELFKNIEVSTELISLPKGATAIFPKGMSYDKEEWVLKFEGIMTDAEKTALQGFAYTDTFTEALEELPSALKFPDSVSGKLSYNSVKKILVFKGPMTSAQKSDLLEKSVDLASLPSEVKFPVCIKARISYDEDEKLLQFGGTMGEDERDELLSLSDNKKYRAAVEALYVKTNKFQTAIENLYKESNAFIDAVGTLHSNSNIITSLYNSTQQEQTIKEVDEDNGLVKASTSAPGTFQVVVETDGKTNSLPVIEDLQIVSASAGGDIKIRYKLTDAEDDLCNIKIQYTQKPGSTSDDDWKNITTISTKPATNKVFKEKKERKKIYRKVYDFIEYDWDISSIKSSGYYQVRVIPSQKIDDTTVTGGIRGSDTFRIDKGKKLASPKGLKGSVKEFSDNKVGEDGKETEPPQVTLNWSAVSGDVTGYNVYRKARFRTGQENSFTAIGSITDTEYTDNVDSSFYEALYRVTAYNDSGESGFSNTVSLSSTVFGSYYY